MVYSLDHIHDARLRTLSRILGYKFYFVFENSLVCKKTKKTKIPIGSNLKYFNLLLLFKQEAYILQYYRLILYSVQGLMNMDYQCRFLLRF